MDIFVVRISSERGTQLNSNQTKCPSNVPLWKSFVERKFSQNELGKMVAVGDEEINSQYFHTFHKRKC